MKHVLGLIEHHLFLRRLFLISGWIRLSRALQKKKGKNILNKKLIKQRVDSPSGEPHHLEYLFSAPCWHCLQMVNLGAAWVIHMPDLSRAFQLPFAKGNPFKCWLQLRKVCRDEKQIRNKHSLTLVYFSFLSANIHTAHTVKTQCSNTLLPILLTRYLS